MYMYIINTCFYINISMFMAVSLKLLINQLNVSNNCYKGV